MPRLLDPGPVTLGAESALHGPSRRPRRPTRWRRWRESSAEERFHPFTGSPAVLTLGAMFGGIDRQRVTNHAVAESASQPMLLFRAQIQGIQIKRQLDPRVSRIHALPTGSGGSCEAFSQGLRGDDEAIRKARPRRNDEVPHDDEPNGGRLDHGYPHLCAHLGIELHRCKYRGGSWRVSATATPEGRRSVGLLPRGSSAVLWLGPSRVCEEHHE